MTRLPRRSNTELRDAVHAGVRPGVRGENHSLVQHDADAIRHALRLVCTRLPVRNATCFWLRGRRAGKRFPHPDVIRPRCRRDYQAHAARRATAGNDEPALTAPLQWPHHGSPNARYAPARRWKRRGPSPRRPDSPGGSGSRGAGRSHHPSGLVPTVGAGRDEVCGLSGVPRSRRGVITRQGLLALMRSRLAR